MSKPRNPRSKTELTFFKQQKARTLEKMEPESIIQISKEMIMSSVSDTEENNTHREDNEESIGPLCKFKFLIKFKTKRRGKSIQIWKDIKDVYRADNVRAKSLDDFQDHLEASERSNPAIEQFVKKQLSILREYRDQELLMSKHNTPRKEKKSLLKKRSPVKRAQSYKEDHSESSDTEGIEALEEEEKIEENPSAIVKKVIDHVKVTIDKATNELNKDGSEVDFLGEDLMLSILDQCSKYIDQGIKSIGKESL